VLIPQSQPAGTDSVGATVLQSLVHQLPDDTPSFGWELRIARDAGNMFAAPDGTIYVDRALAEFLGARSDCGLPLSLTRSRTLFAAIGPAAICCRRSWTLNEAHS
jgi:hypothetical protein